MSTPWLACRGHGRDYLAAMKIYTRTGDSGLTALFGGGRVQKHDPRVAAYGDVDELNAAIGVVITTAPKDFEIALLESIQRDLFAMGAQLATSDPTKVAGVLAKATLTEERVTAFERFMDKAEDRLPPLRSFVLPGGSPKATSFHQARTVCRRAERSVVSLAASAPVSPIVLKYLNRLSDLLFTLARLANLDAGISDQIW
jgi:cob(I)alamin adenosyltransferase